MYKTSPKTYDEVPYPSYAYAQTHPDNLATLATLSGMTPPPVTQCRVLELGCASGGNLIPMAYSLPQSEFIGIDFSGKAVAKAQSVIEEVGLQNISLKHLDILEVDDNLGQFDYIIVYGIFSWVSAAVRDKILDICRNNLVPNGVAYVSYNTYPGWHMNNIIRDMMLYHTRKMDDPETRLEQARAMLKFIAQMAPAEHELYGHFLGKMQRFLETKEDGYLYHDFMETVNRPLYFKDFISQAEQHGLQYLANAEFAAPDDDLPKETMQLLFDLTENIVEVEQYLDFLTNRTFRQTLLCHQDVSVSRTLNPDYLETLYFASRIQPAAANPSLYSDDPETFEAADGKTLSTPHPATKAALIYLEQVWPQSVPFNTLLSSIEPLLETTLPPDSPEARMLATNLLVAYSQSINLIEFHSYAPPFVVEIGERPAASAVARFQAKNNMPVTNLYHRSVTMDDLSQILLEYLDGTRDRAALLEVLLELHAQDVVNVEKDDQPVDDELLIKSTLAEELENQLQGLANVALLVG
jgi:methyltransferase-like protein/predicted O-methyltransferase YrrM